MNKPGPAQDGLNTWAKKHIPGLVIDDLPSSSALGSETATLGFNDDINHITEGRFRPSGGTVTPSGAGQGLGIENAAVPSKDGFGDLQKALEHRCLEVLPMLGRVI